MSELATGTVTFLYTDIEGSTRLWERHGQVMAGALSHHDDIWRTAVAVHEGQIYRVTGDGFCASFSDAHTAVAAAAAAQQALWAEDWGLVGRLKVRSILHTGAAQVRDGDYVGASLNLCGRLLAVCHGGQTLLSGTTAEIVLGQLPPGTELLDLGRHRFRDMVDPVRIFQLAGNGLPAEFPPLSSSATIPHNLPQQLTSFIGREKEKKEVGRLLRENHLVTLVGPGGTGKTRLSIEVASAVMADFSDGVWLIQLAAISDPALVDQTIASVLGIREQPGNPFLKSLATYLRRKNVLLVLDNCEHLIEACAKTAAALFQDCPQLRILASSREGLGIPGEKVTPLHPLSLPQDTGSVPEIAAYEAVRLFVERAALAQAGFSLSADNAAAVAQICRRLDGIPLAIELAAARTRHLSPQQIAARLDQSFRLLTGGSRTALPRQQTLRALIDWSYDLLSAAERILFRRLAIFHGGWTLEAAEAVCTRGSDAATDLDPFDILDLTGQLVEKSMVEADLQAAEPRYRLLETMRQYGLEKLRDAGEAATARDEHLAYYTALALEAELPILRREETAVIDRLEVEHENLLAALEWASTGDPQQFLNLAAALGPFWYANSYASEGRKWLGQSLAQIENSPEPTDQMKVRGRMAQAFLFHGFLAFVQGQSYTAIDAYQKSLQIVPQTGDPFFRSYALAVMSPALMSLGRFAEALSSAQDGVAVARQSGDEISMARSLAALGGILLLTNHDVVTAWQYLEESLMHARKAGNESFQTTPLLILLEAAIASGDYEKAWEKIQEGEDVFNKSRNKMMRDAFQMKTADLYRLQGDYAKAVPIYRHAVTFYREFGNLGAVARLIECLAFIDIHRAGSLAGKVKDETLVRACRLLGAAETIRAGSDATMFPYEQAEYQREVAALQGLMDEESYAAAWAQGRALSVEEAEDFVIRETAVLDESDLVL